jgi:hypothetical protein
MKNQSYIMILAILFLLALLPQIQSETFYIKVKAGKDDNSGLTTDLPVLTWTKVMSLVDASAENNTVIFAEAGTYSIDKTLTLS